MINLILVLVFTIASPIAEKSWFEGKVLNVEVRKDVGTLPESVSGSSTGGAMPINRTFLTYVVVANGTRYQLHEQTSSPRYKEGDSIKFAVEKSSWFYLDAKGKEKKGGDLRAVKK